VHFAPRLFHLASEPSPSSLRMRPRPGSSASVCHEGHGSPQCAVGCVMVITDHRRRLPVHVKSKLLVARRHRYRRAAQQCLHTMSKAACFREPSPICRGPCDALFNLRRHPVRFPSVDAFVSSSLSRCVGYFRCGRRDAESRVIAGPTDCLHGTLKIYCLLV
jgi:hypothetical protein